MIEVQGLTKVYGSTTAIQDVTFSVSKGEILGFLGPNGAGKTTTMRILTCYTPATSGSARVAGLDVFRQSLQVRKRIGYLPETVPLYLDMTVRGYLDFVARAKGVESARRKSLIEQTIEQTSLGHVAQRVIGNLSKGYRQRVGLAQALVGDPEVLILDEPTIGLDPTQIIEIRELIRSLAGKKTVILSTHILPEVSMTCQKVVIINRGRIVASGTPEKLTTDLQTTIQVEAVIRGGTAETVGKALRNLKGVQKIALRRSLPSGEYEFLLETERNADVRAPLASAVVGAGWQLLELKTHGLTLEDIYIKVVTSEKQEVANAA